MSNNNTFLHIVFNDITIIYQICYIKNKHTNCTYYTVGTNIKCINKNKDESLSDFVHDKYKNVYKPSICSEININKNLFLGGDQ